MIIGRLEFGIIRSGSDWGLMRCPCRCIILSLGRIFFTWICEDCKCGGCGQYVCKCGDDVA
jgi:hypothetical protein